MAIGISGATGGGCGPAGTGPARRGGATPAARHLEQLAGLRAGRIGSALAGGARASGGALDSILSGVANLGRTGGILPRGAGAQPAGAGAAAAPATRTDFATRFAMAGEPAEERALLQRSYDLLMNSPTGQKIMSDFERAGTKIRVVDDATFARENGANTMGVFMQTRGAGGGEREIQLPRKVLENPSLGAIILGHEALHANQAQRGAQMGEAAEPEAYDAQEQIARELGVPSPPRPRRYQ